ncbi:DUF4136 domain-containing protein [Salegentibacter chungangensis]|uniref:DUF4136 domain-containing protein n=1 Tax=Salegentibacter chungangensis TaxID=1335724 RepID=A0ABW3NSV8_9FLAO
MKIFKTLLICLVLASCNAPSAVYDYDRKVNFSQYSTYSLFPDFRSGLSQLDEGRLIESLDSALKSKGFSRGDDAGIYVNVYSEEFIQNSGNRVGVGIGGSGRNVGVGVSGGFPLGGPDTYLRLTFDFIDVEDDSLIWQAVVESRFDKNASPEERSAVFDKIVKKALEGYPPKK